MNPLKTDETIQGEPAQPFDPAALGASFEQLAVDVVEGETTDFMSRWFRSREGHADLVVWTDGEKRIIKHQLCFFGQVVEWNPINGTRTGLVIEQELTPAATPGDESGVSEMIHFDRVAQFRVIEQAMAVLSRVPELSADDRSKLIFNFRESPRMHPKARERALAAWAGHGPDLSSTERPTFWKRLGQWVFGRD